METLYLLLRNNRQSGPYTIDELIQQQLKTSDLVWIEGKSSSWLNPSEMPEFEPVYIKAPPAIKNPIEQTLPEKKEDTIEYNFSDKNTYSQPTIYNDPVKEKTEWNHFNNSLPEEEEPIKFIFHKRKRNTIVPHVLGIVLAMALLFAGWHNGWLPVNSKNAREQNVIPLISSDAHAALGTKARPVENKTITQSEKEQPVSFIPEKITDPQPVNSESKPKHKASQKKIKPVLSSPAPVTIITADLVPPQKNNAAIDQGLIPITDSGSEKKDVAEKADLSNDKKRSFGQVIKGLFKKKKKAEDKPLAGTTSQITLPGNQ